MKMVLEGTEEQIKNLKLLMGCGGNELPTIREDYQTGNLWCTEDVTLNYDCTEDEAMDVLEAALSNAATMDAIWFAVHFHAEDFGLTELEK